MSDIAPGEEGWVRDNDGKLVWVRVELDGSHTPSTPPALSLPEEGKPIVGD